VSALVQIVTALERGGAQRIALELAAGLHRGDRPAFLLSGGRDEALAAEARARLRERSVSLRHLRNPLSPLGDLTALVELHRELSRVRKQRGAPLIVHTHSSKAGVLGRLAARAVPGAIVVHTVHGFGFEALGPQLAGVLEGAERVAAAATDALVFVGSADRARADEMRLAPRARHEVIPGFCAVDDDGDRAGARARFGVPDDVPLAVTVANFKPQKDPLFHVEVLAAWRAFRKDARLLFVGDGPLKRRARQLAKERGVSDGLITPGFLEDPRDAYAAGDAFLLASAWEGLPMSALEALARGLAVVARDTGWASDLAFTPRMRALYDGEPPRAYAEALDDAAGGGREPLALPERFTLPGMLRAHERLYDALSASSANT
jgi:glycosyltransferase involved in cell wall biosynthesis